ncbi:MAG: 2,5-furandicarboxylate decarboxylase 1, partial [Alphaproteobacteria bacterium]
MPEGTTGLTNAKVDTEKFRLRSFVASLGPDELEIIEQPVELADLTAHLDGNAKAVLFRAVGPEKAEIAGNLTASRSRLALAFGVAEADLLQEVLRRLDTAQETIEISSADAPVHEIIRTGDDADFTTLPVPFQHGRDGGPYLSSTLDFTFNADAGLTNVGCRRMMIRGR